MPLRAFRDSVLLAVVTTLAGCGAASEEFQPNVVLVVADTTRADRTSVDGYARDTTPNLAAFAKDAVTFRDAWAPCCWTAPSHASLFTGLRPEHHGLTEGVRPYLDAKATTLAERFRSAGWRTACFTNNEWISDQFGLTQGFDLVDPLHLAKDRPYPWAADTHRRALEWALRGPESSRPFFLFVNDMEPHLPYTPSTESTRRFVSPDATETELADARAFDFPLTVGFVLGRTQVTPRKRELLSDLYDAEIADFDDGLAPLFRGLREAGVLDRTIVVIASDHGESLGEHTRLGHLFAMWRQNLRVPLVVRFPGKFDGGRVVTDCVRLEDVAPTLLELCGLPAGPMDGVPLTGNLAGRVARAIVGGKDPMVPAIEAAYPKADLSVLTTSTRAVHEGRFHYIRDSKGHEELFDVVLDPAEANDLAPAGGEALARLRKLLAE